MTRLAIHENSREMSENPNWKKKKKQSVGLLEYKLKAIVSVLI